MGDNTGEYQDLLSAALGQSGLAFGEDELELGDETAAADGMLAAAIEESGLGDTLTGGNADLLAALKGTPAQTLQTVQPTVGQHTTFIVQTPGTTTSRVVKVPLHSSSTTATAISQPQLTRNVISVPATDRQSALSKTSLIKLPVQSTVRTATPSSSGGTTVVKLQPTSQPGVVAMTTIPAATSIATNNGTIKRELSHKDVSRLWSNDDIKSRSFSPTPTMPQARNMYISKPADDEDVDDDEEDDVGHLETYANYMPSKLKLGIPHPDPVVETSSLSSILPPNIWYRLSIPEHVIDYGYLSALQLEAIIYACQQHETFLANGDRAGFLIGDGAGVGKGRTVAGVIHENYLLGRKRALWLSVSNDLKYDAARDLKDIGASNISVHSLNKFKYAKISSKENGSVKKGVIFATYSSLIGESQSSNKYRTRLKQLLQWCGEDFDGVIVLDECHKAKNLCPVGSSKPTKTGRTVLELQKRLPRARVVYCSATGATEPRNMAYMTRLGIWGKGTPFIEFSDFIQAVEKRGVGAMEIVAMDMKLRGMYMARQLSFAGVTFKIEDIPLSKYFVKMYDRAVQLWVLAREKFQEAANLIDADHRMKKTMWGQFWSAHQRFFKYLCIASKVKHAVRLAREAVKDGKCVVIGLQSTGEARTLDVLEEQGGELNDFVSTAKGVFSALVEKHFPAPNRRKMADIFGYDIGRSASNSPEPASRGQKRKLGKAKGGDNQKNKKPTRDNSLSSGDDSNDESDTGGATFKISDDSENSDNSDNDSWEDVTGFSSNEEDDFNPFKDSDSEDDPWLSKRKSKSSKPKPKKTTKKTKNGDPDEMTSSVLLAAGLKQPSWQSTSRSSTPTLAKTMSTNSLSGLTSSNSFSCFPNVDAVEKAQMMKQELLDTLEEIADDLPPNTLDELIDLLGGPEGVAEMTGRKGRVVSNDDGKVAYESRSETDIPLEVLNLAEKKRFMDGNKHIAIISEAASSGISLQADKRAKNQRRRVHITLELPWSGDRAIQQFGRTHRSNQVTAPEYLFLISELAGERRFASIVAKRLESLGALTHGDRRATESRDLSKFNIDNKYGRTALESVMKSVMGQETPMIPPPAEYKGNFFEDVKRGLIGVGMITVDERYNIPMLDREYNNMSKFLNRILGMEVELQNKLFAFFSDTLAAIIQQAKRSGRWDMGILDVGIDESEHVKKLDCKTFVGSFSTGTALTELFTVSAERGLSWEGAVNIWKDQIGEDDGFYVSQQVKNNKRTAILAMQTSTNLRRKLFRLYRPNTGRQLKLETLAEIKKKYKKVSVDEARNYWIPQYRASETQCSHAYWRGNCKRTMLGLSCEVGLRRRTFHILSGSVLSVWKKVETVLATQAGNSAKMQIIRLKAEDGSKLVGCLIPSNCVQALNVSLSEQSSATFTAEDNPISQPNLTKPPAPQVLPTHVTQTVATTTTTNTPTGPAFTSSMPIIL